MDEVARRLSLTRDVRLEIPVDAVVHFAVEGFVQQRFEALQTVRVVGETEFAGNTDREQSSRSLSALYKCTFLCV